MEIFEPILEILFWPLLLVMFLLLVVLPVALPLLLYRFLKKRGYAKQWQLLALTPLLVLVYLVYISMYPGEAFYREDFREVTGITLPELADMEYKSASYADHYGDYASISVIRVGQVFYTALQEHLTRRGMQPPSNSMGSSVLDGALQRLGDRTVVIELVEEGAGGTYYSVMFLSDRQTIVVHRVSW